MQPQKEPQNKYLNCTLHKVEEVSSSSSRVNEWMWSMSRSRLNEWMNGWTNVYLWSGPNGIFKMDHYLYVCMVKEWCSIFRCGPSWSPDVLWTFPFSIGQVSQMNAGCVIFVCMSPVVVILFTYVLNVVFVSYPLLNCM